MSESTFTPVTAEALAEVITEFEQYRDRLVNETMEAAKKAKLSKKAAMSQLEPQLTVIDSKLEQLRTQMANMTTH
jgi:capsule polysaccharide export protein KpsE/RkpR